MYTELTGHFRLWHDPGSFAFYLLSLPFSPSPASKFVICLDTYDRLTLPYACRFYQSCAEAGKAFGDSVGSWPAFPDSAAALGKLNELGLKLFVLSNVDNESFAVYVFELLFFTFNSLTPWFLSSIIPC